jgi:hypothetical protein
VVGAAAEAVDLPALLDYHRHAGRRAALPGLRFPRGHVATNRAMRLRGGPRLTLFPGGM